MGWVGTNYSDWQVVFITWYQTTYPGSNVTCVEFLAANYKSWKHHSLTFMLNTPSLTYEVSVHLGWIVILGLRNEWSQPIISTVKIDQIIIEFPNLLLLQLADFAKKSAHWNLFCTFLFYISPFCVLISKPFAIFSEVYLFCSFPLSKTNLVFPGDGGMLGN